MSPAEVVARWYADGDPGLLDPDVEWHVPGFPVPRERYDGRDAVLDEFFPAMHGRFLGWRAEVEEMIAADGDRVVVTGEYRGATLDGIELRLPFIHLWSVRDGRIVTARSATDTRRFVEALL
jgi:hypothetical protein